MPEENIVVVDAEVREGELWVTLANGRESKIPDENGYWGNGQPTLPYRETPYHHAELHDHSRGPNPIVIGPETTKIWKAYLVWLAEKRDKAAPKGYIIPGPGPGF